MASSHYWHILVYMYMYMVYIPHSQPLWLLSNGSQGLVYFTCTCMLYTVCTRNNITCIHTCICIYMYIIPVQRVWWCWVVSLFVCSRGTWPAGVGHRHTPPLPHPCTHHPTYTCTAHIMSCTQWTNNITLWYMCTSWTCTVHCINAHVPMI